ncbi:transglutaminase domain-containing protein [Thermohalobacter berrensis]|uniref:Transglutaminase-like domain-containing protein n=1 Tax=Thermohalobacter berrensis TaxID=99594 RepID=A0A419T323_9FIRM|nr:transglutaminase domain-containing protein [Thermohalobacter berrensis]RKD31944.1 hypothetical protein BET03_11730 [Thermohalobacter berrensis]
MSNEEKRIPKPIAWLIIIGVNIIGLFFISIFTYFFIFSSNNENEEIEKALFNNTNNGYEENIDANRQELKEINNNKDKQSIGNKTKDNAKKDTDNKTESNEEDKSLPKRTNENKKENSIYDVIKEALITGKKEVDVSDFPEGKYSKSVFEVVEKVVIENPEVLYYKSAEYWSNGILKFEYSKDKSTINKHLNVLKKAKDEIIREIIKPDMSDYEKVKAIHDYIINNSKYDSVNYNNNTIPPESYSAYGILVKGTGVCEGYAEAFKLIMDDLGIESIIVSGRAGNQDHAWNIIKLDGEYYHIDLTWDDPVMDDGSDVLRYDYFNLSDKQMSKDHIWNRSKYPSCNGIKYNYYYYNDMAVENYNQFYNKIKDALLNNKSKLELKILNYNSKIYDIPNTIQDIANKNYNIDFQGYKYSINDSQGIVNIEFIK